MIKSIKIVWFFVGMICLVAGGAFAVFKWIDKQQDADVNQRELIVEQNASDSIFQERIIGEIQMNRVLTDSAIIIANMNRQAIKANRVAMTINKEVILEMIEADSSLTIDQWLEIMNPYMEEIKKNSTWTPYAIE